MFCSFFLRWDKSCLSVEDSFRIWDSWQGKLYVNKAEEKGFYSIVAETTG